MMISWEEYEAAYNADFARAQSGPSCFCACGCQRPSGLTPLGLPTICAECKAIKGHALTRRPVETYDWDAYEARNPSREYLEAEAYVRAVATSSGPQLRAMLDRLTRGERLTDVHVEQALRSKAADKKADEVAATRIERTARRVAKAGDVDLDRVYIPDSVSEGDYAVVDEAGGAVHVRIERPQDGTVWGFTVVTFTVGQAEPLVGLQRPQPWRGDRKNYYSGPYPHLVHMVVSDPNEAESLYNHLKGVAA